MLMIRVIETIPSNRYTLQCRAPNGDWYDSLTSPLLENALSHKVFQEGWGKECRIVQKTIHVIKVQP